MNAGWVFAAAIGTIQPAWLPPARPMRFRSISGRLRRNATPAAMSEARSSKTAGLFWGMGLMTWPGDGPAPRLAKHSVGKPRERNPLARKRQESLVAKPEP